MVKSIPPLIRGKGEATCIPTTQISTSQCQVCAAIGIKESNYSKKYKGLVGVLPEEEIGEVHHLDRNRKNNCCSNLVLIPQKLHREYHKIIYEILYNSDLNIAQFDNKEEALKDFDKSIEAARVDILKIKEESTFLDYQQVDNLNSAFRWYYHQNRIKELFLHYRNNLDELEAEIFRYKREQIEVFNCQHKVHSKVRYDNY